MKSLSGKELPPTKRMNPFGMMILGGLQEKQVYQGTVSAKEKNRRRKKKQHDELSRKRQRRHDRSERMYAKWDALKGGRSVV
jgi:hypothetical protein